jgi:hypothetical protein
MEPEIVLFLKRIVWTLSTLLLWMMVNILFGIKWGYAFFETGQTLGSVLYYIWLAGSVWFLFRLYRKYWN